MNPIDTRQILNWDQVKVHLQPNLCIECQLVPQQPLQCYRCQKLLCQTCHGDLKQKSRGPKIFCQKCKALNYFNPANNAIYQSYRDMVIGCVNRRYGCKVTLDYKKYQKHVEECEFQRIPCPSPGCFVTTLKRAKGDHLQVCEYVIETCQYCNKQFNRKSMAYHQEKCNGKDVQQIDLASLKSDFLRLRSKLDAAISQFEQSAEIAMLEQKVIKQQLEIQQLKNNINQ
ncbi:unnamed protein product [Paramecium octaurelia]|uniref:TRAF-type domain-containing protein n=1 Tax=Paramecium octaurelia TaxID=43137 RepID=A0A8S1VU39_PAROT|nr:unnamed protein product [Paramecium octaurelia]